jgi:AcrR family transcriptional regulator
LLGADVNHRSPPSLDAVTARLGFRQMATQPNKQHGPPSPSGARRSDWLDTRQRILISARRLFSERGFRGTTTKDVAEAAGVAELSLYRHFKTKAQLFEEAAIEPIHDFLREWIQQWTNRPFGSREIAAEGDRFYQSLMDLLASEQKLVATFLGALALDDTEIRISPHARAVMSELLDELEAVFTREGNLRDYTSDPHITPRLIMAMALSIAVHATWLFGDGRVPPQQTLVTEMSNLTIFGLPGASPSDPSRSDDV